MIKQEQQTNEVRRAMVLRTLEYHALDEKRLDSYVQLAIKAGYGTREICEAIRNSLETRLAPLMMQAEQCRNNEEAKRIETSLEYRRLELLLKVISQPNITVPIYKMHLHHSNLDPKYVEAQLKDFFAKEIREKRGIGKTNLEAFTPRD